MGMPQSPGMYPPPMPQRPAAQPFPHMGGGGGQMPGMPPPPAMYVPQMPQMPAPQPPPAPKVEAPKAGGPPMLPLILIMVIFVLVVVIIALVFAMKK